MKRAALALVGIYLLLAILLAYTTLTVFARIEA